jgi:hypothetical protein
MIPEPRTASPEYRLGNIFATQTFVLIFVTFSKYLQFRGGEKFRLIFAVAKVAIMSIGPIRPANPGAPTGKPQSIDISQLRIGPTMEPLRQKPIRTAIE